MAGHSRGWIVVALLAVACDGEPSKSEAVAAAPAKAEPQVKAAEDAPEAKAADAAEAKAAEGAPEAEAEKSPAEQLLHEARRIQYKDPAEAHRIAMEAYEKEPSAGALWVMGPAACRLKDVEKAKWVQKRLIDDERAKFEEICAAKGVELASDPV